MSDHTCPICLDNADNALQNIGACYELGMGVERDRAEAEKWYKRSAEGGNVNGQFNLAALYADVKGEGVPQDNAKGLRCAQLCTENGHAGGMALLNMFQETFESVGERDLISHVNYDSHLPGTNITVVCLHAQCELGKQYVVGKSVAQDYATAMKWIRLAADQDHAEAQTVLGLLYKTEGNPSKDYTKARHWLEIAARQDTLRGAGEAMFNLGSMCLEGMGCPANIAKALRWFQLAGSCEHAEALGTLNK
eukprot:gene1430-15852_t